MSLSILTDKFVTDLINKYGQMTNLNLSSNGIKFIESLQQLYLLEKLNLSCNELTNDGIQSLTELNNIKDLNLSYNKLNTLHSLQHMISLEILDISHNHISTINALKPLFHLPHLKRLTLIGNPITSSSLVYPHAIKKTTE